MTISNVDEIYAFSLLQIAAESYLEDAESLSSRDYLERRLKLGTNRDNYNHKNNSLLGSADLNEGWPGLTRMTEPQVEEFLRRFEVLHQWSDNPCLVNGELTRPAPDTQYTAGLQLNGPAMLANTGFSATLMRDRETGHYTLSFRSTESRAWSGGGDSERDLTATDVWGVAFTGFALAQLDAMEKYYQWLKDNNLLPCGATLNVTGYSLGGHLATVFTEIHKYDPYLGRFGETVTFNGAGRGTWNDDRGPASQLIAYYRQVLNNPESTGIELEELPTERLAYAYAWAVGSGFLDVMPVTTENDLYVLALNMLKSNAVSASYSEFDLRSVYQDARYGWAVIATILEFGIAPQIPGTGHGTTADDRITQVYGFETIANHNMTANSQNNGPELKIGIESQPLIDGLAGRIINVAGIDFKLPGEYGFSHSINLLADSLVLQRALKGLDESLTTQEFIDWLPYVSAMDTQNFIGTSYEADALENILDTLRHFFLGPETVTTSIHEGAGGFGDWQTRNGFHQNVVSLQESELYQLLDDKVTLDLLTPEATSALDARNDFTDLLTLYELSPLSLGVLPGEEAIVEQMLATPHQGLFGQWQQDLAADSPEFFTDIWIQDRQANLHWALLANARNLSGKDDPALLISATAPEGGVQFEDLASGTVIQAVRGAFSLGALGVDLHQHVFGSQAAEELEGGDEEDRLYGMAGADILVGGGDADYLEGGTGIDIYIWRSGDGNDRILDTDEAANDIGGHLVINDQFITEVVRHNAGVYEAAGCFFICIEAGLDEEILLVRDKNGEGGLRLLNFDRETNHFGIQWVEGMSGTGVAGASAGIAAALRPVYRDPLALDLDGDGIETVGVVGSQVVLFDHDGDGVRTGTGWVGPDDAWLVLDRNGNGSIDNGGELFGIDTVLQSGSHAADGFAALREWDGNGDGVITAVDEVFAGLQLWRDLNQDGISQAGELQGLAEQGIVSIGVNGVPGLVDLGGGNVQTAAGTFTRSNGSTGSAMQLSSTAANLNLLSNTFYRDYTDTVPLSEAAALLPQVAGSGRVRDLQEAASLSPGLLAVLQDYLEQDSRETQRARLDEVLSAWAATSDLGSLQKQFADLNAQGNPATLTYQLQGYAAGSTAAAEMLRRIAVVECFMGGTYMGNGMQTSRVDPATGSLTVALTSVQLNAINTAYALFSADIYSALLMQSRLAPYADAIHYRLAEDGSVADFSATVALFDQAIAEDAQAGVTDLVEFISGFGADSLQALGWEALPYLAQQLSLAPELAGFAADLSDNRRVLFAAAGQQPIVWGGAGDDLLVSAATATQLNAEAGDDALVGQGGNDLLQGGDGNDILYGGAGNDGLNGGNGRNTYLYRAGEGLDVVQALSAGEQGSVVRLLGAQPDEVTVTRTGRDIEFGFSGHSGGLVLQGFVGLELGGFYAGVSSFVFEDGTIWSLDDVLDRVLIPPTEGGDRLFSFNRGDVLQGLGGDDTLVGGTGRDVLQGDGGHDNLGGGEGDDLLHGGDGDDSLRGMQGDDILIGGKGNDVLYGEAGADTYRFARGDGQDVIETFSTGSGYVNDLTGDVVEVGYAASDFRWHRDGEHLVLGFRDSSDSISISQYFAGDGVSLASRIQFRSTDFVAFDYAAARFALLHGTAGDDRVTGFAADDEIGGGAGNDILIGGDGNDTLDGGRGDDTLALDTGDDIFILAAGGGRDDVKVVADVDISAGVGSDTIHVVGATVGQVRVGRLDASRFALNLAGTGDMIVVSSLNPGFAELSVTFADGTRWTSQYLQSLAPITEGADRLVLFDTSDTLSMLGGDDIVFAAGGNDTVDGGAGNDEIDGGAGNDRLLGAAGNDQLWGGTGSDRLEGGSDDDVLYGGDDNDTLVGGSGADILEGGAGNDIFYEGAADGAADTLRGGSGHDDYYLGDAIDVVIEEAGGGDDRVTLSFAGAFTIGAHLEYLVLDQQTGNYHITGNAQGNYIDAWRSQGSNYFAGGAGDDTYYHVTSNDYVSELQDGGTDTVYAAIDWYTPGEHIENVTLINPNGYGGVSSVWSLFGNARDNVFFNDSGYAAHIQGADGNDTLRGGAGNDQLDGGSGSNSLSGGAGNDVLLSRGSTDSLQGGRGNDSLQLGGGSAVCLFEAQWGDDQLVAGSGEFVFDFRASALSDLRLTVEPDGSYRLAHAGNGAVGFALAALDRLNRIVTTDGNLTRGEWLDWLAGHPGNYVNRSLYGPAVTTVAGARYSVESSGGEYLIAALDAEGQSLGEFGVHYRTPLDSLAIAGDGRLRAAVAAGITSVALPDLTLLIGTDGADDFSAAGGTGTRWMVGGAGADVYGFGAGDGRVFIDVAAVDGLCDLVVLGSGYALSAARLSRSGEALVLDAGAADSLVIRDYFGDLANPPVLRLASGEEFSRAAVAMLMFGATSGSDTLQGTAGNDVLFGWHGDDVLQGFAGNDTLEGGDGSDRLEGGAGDDTYLRHDAQDTVVELAGEGYDVVRSWVDAIAVANVEELWLEGAANLNASGDAAGNFIVGNSGHNCLDGAGGADYLRGGAGDDLYVVDNTTARSVFGGTTYTGDTIVEYAGEGSDTVESSVSYTLTSHLENLTLTGTAAISGSGNERDNILRGNSAANTLTGGLGNDTYYIGAGDTVVEAAQGGDDTVVAEVSLTLTDNVETLILASSATALNATGNAGNNRLVGNALANTLDGGAGADRMEGGEGGDAYVVDNAGDVIVELEGEDLDSVRASVSHTLAQHVENLTLTGTKAIHGWGNEGDNVLTGNSAANTLAGGRGNDVYVVDSRDTIRENFGEGIDTVQSATTLTLGAHLENLVLTGTAKINGTGNELNNRLVGNAATNILKGGRGDDTYVVGTGDTVTENAGEGFDTVESSVTWTLGNNLENLTLTGQQRHQRYRQFNGQSSARQLDHQHPDGRRRQ